MSISVPINTSPRNWTELAAVLRELTTLLKHDTHTHTLADITDDGTMAAVNDAPADGSTYGRKDNAWAAVSGGGVQAMATAWFDS